MDIQCIHLLWDLHGKNGNAIAHGQADAAVRKCGVRRPVRWEARVSHGGTSWDKYDRRGGAAAFKLAVRLCGLRKRKPGTEGRLYLST